jgi:DNA-binding NtrC family response regulator
MIALYTGNHDLAREYLSKVLPLTSSITYVRFGALDALAQVELRSDDLGQCHARMDECADVLSRDRVPARSWYDFAHQLTRCAYFERLGDWARIIEIADDADAELARRQYKALRTSLLCAKARALARRGRHAHVDATLAAAVRACPRGAVDPLIILEASKALCLSLRGDAARGALHYDRALAACRAIGHRYHEWWIARDRADVLRATRETVAAARPHRDITDTALLLGDVAAVLGAGHSIDLLAHRLAAILQSTTLADRVDVTSEAGRPYRPDPTAAWNTDADGTFTLRLRGSDRRVDIRVGGVATLDEISLLKSVGDLVQAAVNRTADTEAEDDDLTLWPRRTMSSGDDTIFRSPRMVELLRVAERLAAANLPILITGETGTGKEVIARLIHAHSPAKRGPFVPFNCSAVPRELVESQLFGHRRGAFTGAMDAFPGVIRAAERGTLFLDEVGDLDPATQPKLLRFLESGEIHPVGDVRPQRVNVRVVAATNADLDGLADQGRFRRDLFYRLGVARIALPPLRERKDEIPALAALFLSRYAHECGRAGLRLGDDLIAALLLYDWPGNIRQLANEIRRVAAMASDGDLLGPGQLAPEIVRHWNARPIVPVEPPGPRVAIRLDQPLARAMDDLEKRFIEHALESAGGRVADAAQLLGLSRKGLFLKRRRQGLVGGDR